MRIGTVREPSGLRAVIVVGDIAVDLGAAARASGAMPHSPNGTSRVRRMLEAPLDAREAVASAAADLVRAGPTAAIALGDVRLGPPVPDPSKILCLGLNYAAHIAESGLERPTFPEFFAKFPNALVGPDDDVLMPAVSADIDYEGELALVIGSRAKEVAVDDALDYVAGYMVLNDVSARDLQMRGSQWLPGKVLDTFAPCGPLLVTPDELGDPQDLSLRTTVNGRTVQDSRTSAMVFSIAEGISYLSSLMTLEPGDIISTGTPSGVAFGMETPVWLKAGDVVEVEIETLGKLSNRFVAAT